MHRSPKAPATGEDKNKRKGSSKVGGRRQRDSKGRGSKDSHGSGVSKTNTSAQGLSKKGTESEELEIAPSSPHDDGAASTPVYFLKIIWGPKEPEFEPSNVANVEIDSTDNTVDEPSLCSRDLKEDDCGSAYQDLCDVLCEVYPFDRRPPEEKAYRSSPKWIPFDNRFELTSSYPRRIPNSIC
ncbi:uncharacterized protein LOC126795006 [Argentina anserina]|uniref:uncharacterized protein LOC126795006 n=1 Tax=Argentina anserina TaxID=57926 RepID=UPI00217679B3|nr:uncharacterized protein LOC126795006 [Potentilla anserina]